MTPYQAWYGDKPDLSRLRVIGSRTMSQRHTYGIHPYQPLDATYPWRYQSKHLLNRATTSCKRTLSGATISRKRVLSRATISRNYHVRVTMTRSQLLNREFSRRHL
ncbi:hypothetical protein PSPO01_15698 [Paraphaeosphaeria sporulosa]